MTIVARYLRELWHTSISRWDRFWFTPSDPATLAVVRILAGAMLLYTHLVWTLDLEAFFGADSWVSPASAKAAFGDNFAWSYLWLVQSREVLWTLHIGGLVILAMFMLGLFTRVTSILACVIAISYVNRSPLSLFGLDQINCLLTMYVAIGRAGDAWSLDRWRAARRAGQKLSPAVPSVSTNVAIRLIQVHMAIIYFFAGLSKLQGGSWWEGSALWLAFANLEYQSLDMTWTAGWPHLVAAMTEVTVWWELSFCVLIWPRLLRPIVLLVAIPLHLGIGICLGMMTFGLVMLIGCLSFVPPEFVRALLSRGGQASGAGEGRGVEAETLGRSTASGMRGVRTGKARGTRAS